MPDYQMKNPTLYAVMEGIKAAMGEWQRATEKRKQDALTRMLLGMETEADRKILQRDYPQGIPRTMTTLGKAEEEQRRYEEEVRIAAEKQKEDIRQFNIQQERYRQEAIVKKQQEEEETKTDLMKIAIKGAAKMNWNTMTEEVDWMKAQENYQKLLISRGIKPDTIKMPQIEIIDALKYHFLRKRTPSISSSILPERRIPEKIENVEKVRKLKEEWDEFYGR